MEAKDYIGKPRNTKVELDLLKKLRSLEPEERYNFISEFFNYDMYDIKVGLMLANRSLRGKKYFKKILRQGIKSADVSTIRFWLECCLPRLGAKEVIKILSSMIDKYPEGVFNSLYWAKILIGERDNRYSSDLDEIEKEVRPRIGDYGLIKDDDE